MSHIDGFTYHWKLWNSEGKCEVRPTQTANNLRQSPQIQVQILWIRFHGNEWLLSTKITMDYELPLF